MSKETGGPAFPVETQLNPISNQACKRQTGDSHVYQFPEMTLRDYFAAKALQGELASGEASHDELNIARRVYAIADAMIKVRNT